MRGVIATIIFCFVVASAVAQDTTKLSLLFVGDIMQHDSQLAAAYEPISKTYNYEECFQYLKPVFESADMTIGNLELALGGSPYKGYPNFSAPDAIVESLIGNGVDVLVTANNHCLDRGKKGLQRTIAVLDTMRIPHTGTFVDSAHRANTYPLLLEKNGFRISLLNYTYGTNGIPVTKPNIVNYIDTTQIAADIVKAKAQLPDFIAVFVHWGDEYQRLPNKAQKDLTEFCFKKGVKLVIGAHPHVIQPMEWRKETDQLVVYSLGNFVSGQTSRYKNGGAMAFIELEKKDSTVSITRAEYDLQFVYRNPLKKFIVVPVQQFEDDSTLINEAPMRASIRQFAQDSRTLMMEHNLNIGEKLRLDSMYFIMVDTLSDSSHVLKFYGMRNDTVDGKPVIAVGEFYDKEIAIQALTELKAQHPEITAVLGRRRKH